MPDETRTYAQLTGTDFVDNAPTKAINAQKLRNLVKTLEQIVRALNTTERGAVVLRSPTDTHGVTVYLAGTNGKGIAIRPEVDLQGKYAVGVYGTSNATIPRWWIDAGGSMWLYTYFVQDGGLIFGSAFPSEFGAHMRFVRADVNACDEMMTANLDGNYFTSHNRYDGLHLSHINGDGTYELFRRGAGYVLADEDTGDVYRMKVKAGVVTPEKIGDFASTGSAAATPVHVTTVIGNVEALGAAGDVIGVWARDARVTAVQGRGTVWAEARNTAGRALNGVLAYVNPAGDPESGRFCLPRWDGTRFRFFNGQRMQSASTADFRAANVRTIAVVGKFEAENPANIAHIGYIQDGSNYFSFGVLQNLIQTEIFDGSSLNRLSSGVAASRTTRRCAILTRSTTDFSIQVAPSARVSQAHADFPFNAATSRLMIGGTAGTYLTGEIDAVVAMRTAASQAQADAIIAWAAAQYGSAS